MNTTNKSRKEEVWIFYFALEREDGQPLDISKPAELLEVIRIWAEENGCQIGGGYRAPIPSDFKQEC